MLSNKETAGNKVCSLCIILRSFILRSMWQQIETRLIEHQDYFFHR